MLVAFENYPVIFSGFVTEVGFAKLEEEWVQLSLKTLGDSCKSFFAHGLAD